MSKIKTLKVKTELGEFPLTVSTVNTPEDTLVCESRCPYGPCKNNQGKPLCELIPDPLHLNDKDLSFKDYCGELGRYVAGTGNDSEGEDELEDILENTVPIEGSVEKLMLAMGQDDVYQQLIEKKHLVSVDKVIDCVCADGFCESFDESHKNCHSGNQFCLLKSILYKKVEELPEEVESETENQEKEGDGEQVF